MTSAFSSSFDRSMVLLLPVLVVVVVVVVALDADFGFGMMLTELFSCSFWTACSAVVYGVFLESHMAFAFAFASCKMFDVVERTVRFGFDKILVTRSLALMVAADDVCGLANVGRSMESR